MTDWSSTASSTASWRRAATRRAPVRAEPARSCKAEFSKAKHVRGTCSMARTAAPHSADCQFFIMFEPARSLDGQYTIWGQVTKGMELVDAIKKGNSYANGLVTRS